MILQTMVVGPLQTNCFLLGCEKERVAIIIDPGGNADDILKVIEKHELELKIIIATHAHFDHLGAVAKLMKESEAKLYVHKADWATLERAERSAASWGMRVEQPPVPDFEMEEGDEITAGTITLKVLHTPGHSPGGISLSMPGRVFAGDTLFYRSIGRTDFPGGDFDTLINSIKTKLFTLPDDTIVHTGHGPDTRIGDEKKHNPFID
ncbi:MAG: MBL fold metallo-hydrolase [Thermoplasmata archaeon]|nr:MAG: MBL fold metallo-hydrolase [Thermoplasmata archaeon]